MIDDKHVNTPTSIPFSWEMIPGVPKLQATPAAVSIGEPDDQEVNGKALSTPPPPPPPPGSLRRSMKRSMSSRVFWRDEDPFLAALKECSKDYKKGKGDMKNKRFGIWGSKSFLWCRCSFDVEEGNLRGRTAALASSAGGVVVPRERVESLIRMQKGLRN